MSTFFVNSETINAVLHLILKTEGPRSIQNLTDLGKSLWMLNALSVEVAYKKADAQEFLEEIQGFQFKPLADVSFEATIKAVECFLYQCDEIGMDKFALLRKVQARSKQFDHLKETPAYQAAPWGICG